MADDGLFQADGHVEEGSIHGWIEEQLDATDARRVEAHVAGCAECGVRVAEARGLIAGASRVLASLDRPVEAGMVVPAAFASGREGVGEGAGSPSRFYRRSRPAWLAAAAAVVLMVGSAYMWERISGDDVAVMPFAERSSAVSEASAPAAPPMPSARGAAEVPTHLERAAPAGPAAASAPTISALAAAPTQNPVDGEGAGAQKTAAGVAGGGVIGSVDADRADVARSAERIPSTGEVAARAAAREMDPRSAANDAFSVDRTAVAREAPRQQMVLRRAPAGRAEPAAAAPPSAPPSPPEAVGLGEIVSGCFEILSDERERLELRADGRAAGAAGAWWASGRDTIEVAWAAGGSARFEIRAAGDTLASDEVRLARVICG
jgi:hypothetical protein